MGVIKVEPAGGRGYQVEVAEETAPGVHGLTFSYRVWVDDDVITALELDPDDDAALVALVRESFGYLLAREPATAILQSFDLSTISRYFPSYLEEIRERVPR
ncbi:hypothetical protein Ga0074812_101225 [Parafrankia irregularis]|uniref:Immunity protein 8 n=1 Tax=Parafrankia irregularis TaxID=795642 RepID=A0A0S4QEY7_9ACTN|nr:MULTISPECIES: hypothetical protein [Parafrankia]MBE3199605.1 hypothetical protein [Parafrankia sp. CH37]CUU53727.1 hypothetical protein Ga0074812_101225 [Parafrankia irregularis]